MPAQTFFSSLGSTLLQCNDLVIRTGLTALVGDEGSGKTQWLRRLASCDLGAGSSPGLWLDLSLPGQDKQRPADVWSALKPQCPHWQANLLAELIEALQLQPHLDKQLFMLSTGSRRKVALAALMASGAPLTCLDQPFAALDRASIRVVREFLHDMADHPTRAWVVADYEADAELPWASHITLP